jgi:hypothetical protein
MEGGGAAPESLAYYLYNTGITGIIWYKVDEITVCKAI